MTAASVYPPGSDQGLSEGRVAEPSMEDILASIRRIIADDQQANGSRVASRRAQLATGTVEAVPTPVSSDREDVLDLAQFASAGEPVAERDAGHDAVGEPPGHAGQLASDERDDEADAPRDGAADETEPHPHDATPEHFDVPDSYAADGDPRQVSLLAAPMSESVMSAFEALAATVVLENKPMLEGILRDLLRPMLKAWLDDNLPGLVERLVRIEIERVARGGRH